MGVRHYDASPVLMPEFHVASPLTHPDEPFLFQPFENFPTVHVIFIRIMRNKVKKKCVCYALLPSAEIAVPHQTGSEAWQEKHPAFI